MGSAQSTEEPGGPKGTGKSAPPTATVMSDTEGAARPGTEQTSETAQPEKDLEEAKGAAGQMRMEEKGEDRGKGPPETFIIVEATDV